MALCGVWGVVCVGGGKGVRGVCVEGVRVCRGSVCEVWGGEGVCVCAVCVGEVCDMCTGWEVGGAGRR